MKPRKDLTGQRFGRYLATAYIGSSTWECRCDCGNVRNVLTGNLTSGNSLSCGCKMRADSKARMTRHGLSDTPIHRSWMSMRQRCLNVNDGAYINYGGRGITICARWDSFENFAADMGALPANHEIERIDVNGNYEPSNCKWASAKEQSRNKRNTHLITFEGKTLSLAEWKEIKGLTTSAMQKRIRLGWPVDKLLNTPVRSYSRAAMLVRLPVFEQ